MEENEESPLKLFEKYADQLDDMFDDSLDISYQIVRDKSTNKDIPTYRILYDPSVDYDQLVRSLPKEWIEKYQEGGINICLVKFTEETEEYKLARYIVNGPLKEYREQMMYKLQQLLEKK